jgi:hypothetical protein
MIPRLNVSGDLPPGIDWASWDEVAAYIARTARRRTLLDGLLTTLLDLQAAGCRVVFVDGSFVTSKVEPADFDACWDPTGVNLDRLPSALPTFDPGRSTQKAAYGGELFPAAWPADERGAPFLEFFQTDRDRGTRKGIIAIELGGLT